MQRKGSIILIASVSLCLIATSVFCFCAPKDPAATASKIAEEWTSNNVDSVSKSIASLVANNNPLIEKAIALSIANKINERISWEYSPPQKLAEERYKVVTTAYSEIELPLLGSYRVSVNYNLEIDTKLKQVTAADMDASSFAMRKL